MKNTPTKAVKTDEPDTAPPLAQTDGGASQTPQNITGRAVFVVDTSAAGIVVRTAFLTEQGQVIDMPAVFPDMTYALNQIDHLRKIVLDRFSQAVQVGVQVIASSAAQQEANATSAGSASAPSGRKDEPTAKA